MTRALLIGLLSLILAGPAWAQTWTKVPVPPRSVDQPTLSGNQSLAPGEPGAALTTCPRPVTIDASIFRSYSGMTCDEKGNCASFGGGHAGHPGNDIDLYSTATRTWTKPYSAECPPPYLLLRRRV
jgi:Galactose oxidase, central domain